LATLRENLSPRALKVFEGQQAVADAYVEGYRGVVCIRGGRMRVFGRHNDPMTLLPQEYTPNLPACQLAWDPSLDVVVDCMLLSPRENMSVLGQHCLTRLDVTRTLLTDNTGRACAWQRKNPEVAIILHAFDCLWLRGKTLTDLDTHARKTTLTSEVFNNPAIQRLELCELMEMPYVVGGLSDWLHAADQWYTAGYNYTVVKPMTDRGYDYLGGRSVGGWVKLKPGCQRIAQALGGPPLMAYVGGLLPEGAAVMRTHIQVADGRPMHTALPIGSVKPLDGQPLAIGQVWEVDAPHWDPMASTFRHLRLTAPRTDRQPGDCRVSRKLLDALAIKVCNF
jgi:hypothetical protein